MGLATLETHDRLSHPCFTKLCRLLECFFAAGVCAHNCVQPASYKPKKQKGRQENPIAESQNKNQGGVGQGLGQHTISESLGKPP